jgi:hypothetical protein
LKKAFIIAIILILLGLTACSNETSGGKQTGQEGSTDESTKGTSTKKQKVNESLTEKEMEILAQEYNLDQYRFLPNEEQEKYIVPLFKSLGYNESLALWVSSQINDPENRILSTITTVNEYAEFYVENGDIEDEYKLEWKKAEEKALAAKGIQDIEFETDGNKTIKIVAADVEKRLQAIEGKPLLEIKENGQYHLLGITVGDSGGEVFDYLGEPDHIGEREGGINYVYYMPAHNSDDSLEYYRLFIPIVGGSIQEITLTINNKDSSKANFEMPKEFINGFQGDIYASGLTDQLFAGWNDAFVYFISTASGITDSLKIEPEGNNDFTLRAKVLSDFELEDLTQVHNEIITLDEAMEIINAPESFYEKSEKYFE